MVNIKSMKTDKDGNVNIESSSNVNYNLLRTNLEKLTLDKDTGGSIKTTVGFDVYTHCYEDLTMKNPKRTATLVIRKGVIPPKNWWVNEEIKPVEDKLG